MDQADDIWTMRAILKGHIAANIKAVKCESTSEAGEGHVTETWHELPQEITVIVAGSDLGEFTIPPKYVRSIQVEHECDSVNVARGVFDATLIRFDDRFRRATYYCEAV